jgi:hyperosmotically inducible periplasmic protein
MDGGVASRGENKMKRSTVVKVLASAIVALVSLTAAAQDGSATDASAVVLASNAKATKAANRALQKSVRKAMSRDRGLNLENLTVRARGGVVTLMGTVPSAGQVGLATQITQNVPGVTSVVNQLAIRPVDSE